MVKKTILVIDDESGAQHLLQRRLEAEGYAVILAADGETGLERYMARKPDIILTDLVMPKMSGIEFLSKLRKIKGGDKVPVIVISKRALI